MTTLCNAIYLGSFDISDSPPHVIPECLDRASMKSENAGFPLHLSPRRGETCGNDMPSAVMVSHIMANVITYVKCQQNLGVGQSDNPDKNI
jgi:hypothetical protein